MTKERQRQEGNQLGTEGLRRRSLIQYSSLATAVAGGTVIAGLSNASNAAASAVPAVEDVSSTFVAKNSLVFNVKDFGAKGDYSTNDTVAIQLAIKEAQPIGGTVLFPGGTYTCDNLVLPDFVRLQGEGGSVSRFTNGSYYLQGTRRAGVALRRVTGSENPLLTMSGTACWVENFELQGNRGTAPILVHSGFQTTLKSVTCIGGAGIGIDVQKCNNSRWYDVEVQNCGSMSLPGVKIWSKTGAGLANETNTLDVYGLTIERCTNVHLDIGYNPQNLKDPEYWVEFVRITNLHIESSGQNSGAGSNIGNTSPAVRVGAVRSVHLTNPFLYAGPGPVIEHNQQFVRTYLDGGIKLVNGTIIGSDANTGLSPSKNLVNLINGNDFSMDSMRWARCTGPAVVVGPAYGACVRMGNTNQPHVSIGDQRAIPSEYVTTGTSTLSGHLQSSGNMPTVVNGVGVVGSALQMATDTKGFSSWGTTATPKPGVQQQINFARPYSAQPVVVLTPLNAATAALDLYVSTSETWLKICSRNAPGAKAAAGTYAVAYMVIG